MAAERDLGDVPVRDPGSMPRYNTRDVDAPAFMLEMAHHEDGVSAVQDMEMCAGLFVFA